MLGVELGGFGEEVVALWEAVLGNDVGGHAREGMGHDDGLAGGAVLGETCAELVDNGLDEQRLQAGDGLLREVRIPRFTA